MRHWKKARRIPSKAGVGFTWFVTSLDGNRKQGYFKRSTPSSERYSGPLAADEYIAFRLGKEFGLPVADLELARIDGKLGIVSIKRRNSTLCDWNTMLARYPNPIAHVVRPHRLLKMFVFGIWIANIDRNGRNIILYPTRRNDTYNFYLVDHGLSLLGAIVWRRVKWNDQYWDDVAGYNRRHLRGLRAYAYRNRSRLRAYAAELRSIDDRRIQQIVRETPFSILKKGQRDVVLRFLIRRKRRIGQIINRWLREYARR